MTRSLPLWLLLLVSLALGSAAHAQIDYDALRDGARFCPEIAADPEIGVLSALCFPSDGTLDLPIKVATKFFEVRAGSFALFQRQALLALARGELGESEFVRLRGLLLAGMAPSTSQETLRRALVAQAADPATDPVTAAALLAQAAAIRAGTFDEAIPALLQTRIDRDRVADLHAGRLHGPGAFDSVSSFASSLVRNLGAASVAGVPGAIDADGQPLSFAADNQRAALPFMVGPDGVAATADDLPYVANNPAAQAAGYSLGPPITGTREDRFDEFTYFLLPRYVATAKLTVDSATSPGIPKTVEIYGVLSPAVLVGFGCADLAGVFDAATATCAGGGADLTDEARSRGCPYWARLNQSDGFGAVIGTNLDGDCVDMHTRSTGAGRIQFEMIELLGDPALRPAVAALEPPDLTDLGSRPFVPPARPVSPSGDVSFPDPLAPFQRKVDPTTGAPITATGSSCGVRVDGLAVPIGPNGVAGDGDDAFPSAGDCLLWDPPDSAGAQQLRAPASVAELHTANQSLFHLLCTLTFDGDVGRCLLDMLNDARASATYYTLSGLSLFAGLSLDGLDAVRRDPTSAQTRHSTQVLRWQLLPINPNGPVDQYSQDMGLVLESRQAAVLGCGSSFATPCTNQQWELWLGPAIPSLPSVRFTGIDLMSADASVLFQEFATVKALQADSLVGTNDTGGSLAYLPGINFSRNGTLAQAPAPETAPFPTFTLEAGDYLELSPAQVLALDPAGRAAFQHGDPDKVQADGWVEPMPWAVDPGPLADFGAVVFVVDPADPISGSGNVWNALPGEYCGGWMNESASEFETPFNQTCTALETISANLERLLIAGALIGQDRAFDPPETSAEIVAMLDGDPTNDATGDPISGPDGIFAPNAFVFDDAERDFTVVEAVDLGQLGLAELELPPADKALALQYLLGYDPSTECTRAFCFLRVSEVLSDPGDLQSALPLVLALPIGTTVDLLAEPNDPSEPPTVVGQTKLNLAALALEDRHLLHRVLAREALVVAGQFVRMNIAQQVALLGARGDQSNGRDLDRDGTTDLDRDSDGVWDGMDDYQPGPISDDEIVCGSGLPGDLLQDGLQYEPYRTDLAQGTPAFEAAIPNGLAPRSAVFCRTLKAFLALKGPVATPDASDAFVWHGGASAPESDPDGDGLPSEVDNCPTLANASQIDGDADAVGDACDSCLAYANPRMPPLYLASNPWATLTGGQRDDDHDGFGNKCDADFTGTSAGNVSPADLQEFRASQGASRLGDTCGTSNTRPCAIFDLDENQGAPHKIAPNDLFRMRQLKGRPPGPKCPSCPLACQAGPQGSCS